jgi:hypothetical protein
MDPLPYAPFYCEENAWHIAQDPRVRDRDPHVVFVTNAHRHCALLFQRAAHAKTAPVIWDYHVFVVAKADAAQWDVWDPDTLLGCPVLLRIYLEKTFAMRSIPRFAPRFRVVAGAEYVRTFSSDRRHMRNDDGAWQQPPPPWGAIVREGIGSNLETFLDVNRVDAMDLGAFAERFGVRLS